MAEATPEDGKNVETDENPSFFLFLPFDIVDDRFLRRFGIGEGTIAVFPFYEIRESVAVGFHEVVCGDFQVVGERCRRMFHGVTVFRSPAGHR